MKLDPFLIYAAGEIKKLLNKMTVVEVEPDDEVHVHWKGAAEIVLAACTRYMDDNEQLVALDEAKDNKIPEEFRASDQDVMRWWRYFPIVRSQKYQNTCNHCLDLYI